MSGRYWLAPNVLMMPGFPPGGCLSDFAKLRRGVPTFKGRPAASCVGKSAAAFRNLPCKLGIPRFFPSRPCLWAYPVAGTLHVRQTAPEQEAARLQARGKRINQLTNLTQQIMKRDEAIRDITTKFAELLAITAKPHRKRQLK